MTVGKWRLGFVIFVAVVAIFANCHEYTSAQPTTYTIYLPVIFMNARYIDLSGGGTCGSDPARGELYRDLYANMLDVLEPIAYWLDDQCCSLAVAREKGAFVGNVLQLIPTIAYSIITQLWNGLTRAISFISSIVTIMNGNPTGYYVDCTEDAELFCFGLGAVMALDHMAGGWVTALVILIVAILGFYLVLYVIKEVRAMLQPGDSE